MRFLGQLFGEVFHLGHKSLDKALHPDSMNRFSNNVLERSKAAFGVEGESLEEFHSAYAVRLASRNLEEQRPLKYQAVLDQAMDQGYGEDQAARIAGQQADAFVQQNFKPLA
ncbi:MAG: hypothetical protein K9G62_09000, partial [Alphaproteobacteria bacterium]|nr:hypothetical protein [Alphaproteobacteria bacterium]